MIKYTYVHGRGLKRKVYQTARRRKHSCSMAHASSSHDAAGKSKKPKMDATDMGTFFDELLLPSGAPNISFFHGMNFVVSYVNMMLQQVVRAFFRTYSDLDQPLDLRAEMLAMNIRYAPILGVFLQALLKPNFEEIYGPENYMQQIKELLRVACDSLATCELGGVELERNLRKVKFFSALARVKTAFGNYDNDREREYAPTSTIADYGEAEE